MLEIIEDCCSPYYLEMMRQSAISSESWNMRYPQGRPFEDKHLKLEEEEGNLNLHIKFSLEVFVDFL